MGISKFTAMTERIQQHLRLKNKKPTIKRGRIVFEDGKEQTGFTGEDILKAPDGVYKVIWKTKPDEYCRKCKKDFEFFGSDQTLEIDMFIEEIEKIILIEKD